MESECTWLKKPDFLGFNDGLFFSMECYVFIIDLFPSILISDITNCGMFSMGKFCCSFFTIIDLIPCKENILPDISET